VRRAPRREAGIELRRLDDSDSYSSRAQIRRLRRHSVPERITGAAPLVVRLGRSTAASPVRQVFSAARRTSPSSGPGPQGPGTSSLEGGLQDVSVFRNVS
jgi:hypothetical protein